jgi:hypothetical protein
MEYPLQPSHVIVLLQTHGFDLLAHVEAATRAVREIQRQVITLKEQTDTDVRADALHAIRQNAAALLVDHEGFCATLRDVQMLAAQISPERRRTQQFVMWDRRRRGHSADQLRASAT